MSSVFARKALLPEGWTNDVRMQVDGARLGQVDSGVTPEADEYCADIVIPGICNAHSHAFQRALVGRTEQRSPAGRDNFWSWRTRMYELANRISVGQLEAIASQAYAEMLEAGYTSVAEFHYLHEDPHADGDAMFVALQNAAANSGIRFSYIPVLYERAGFDQAEPEDQQRRFVLSLQDFLAHHSRCREKALADTVVGVGAHSLRAVHAESLQAIAKLAREQGIPMHIHVAEQQAEVEQCKSATGKRPVEWLLDNVTMDDRWCLIHATHMNDAEVEAVADSGAVVCICPTTEANLGDGIFPLPAFLNCGGRIAIGTDSQVSINPFEELRWLEYGQRLSTLSRNVATLENAHAGQELFGRAVAGGAQAVLRSAGITNGASADFVSLNADDPMLVSLDDEALLDALVFAGLRLPIDRVMVSGAWRVVAGKHLAQRDLRGGFAAAMMSLR